MKYTEFKTEMEKLDACFSVLFTDYCVYVYCDGEEVARINTTVPYNLVAQNCYKPSWGTEAIHEMCFKYCVALAATPPKNRGMYPKEDSYAGLVVT